MHKLEKIILECLAELIEDDRLKSLEGNISEAKVICKTVRKVVKAASEVGVIDLVHPRMVNCPANTFQSSSVAHIIGLLNLEHNLGDGSKR